MNVTNNCAVDIINHARTEANFQAAVTKFKSILLRSYFS